MPKITLRTLALNAIRAKKTVQTQQAKLQKLNDELVSRAEGSTFHTELGLVIVTETTFDRPGQGFINVFDEDAFMALDPKKQLEIVELGVVKPQKKMIAGQAPRVQYRFNSNG
jgi:hypothetical protein